MPINVIINDRKFYNQLKNGLTFTSNTSDYTTNLAGSIGERIKAVLTVRVDWYSAAINGDSFTFTTSGHITRLYNSFIDDGFAIGDTFDYCPDLADGSVVFSGTVTFVTDTDLYYTVSSGTEPSAGTTQTSKYIRGLTQLNAIQYKFGIIENDEALNFINKVTGQEQAYYVSNISTSGAGVQINGVKNWETGSINVTSSGYSSTYYQNFQIEHEFTILPYWAPAYDQYLKDGINPPLFAGTYSPKYVCEMDFRVVFSNPNGAKVGNDQYNRGSVGWFNENFNGLYSNWYIDEISYHDALGNPIDAIQASGTTRVQITSKSINPAPTSDRFALFIAKATAPDTVDLTKTYDELYLFNSAVKDIINSPADFDYIKNCKTYYDSPDTLLTVFDVQYSAPQTGIISTGDKFVIGIAFDDSALLSTASDKVMLLADWNDFTVDNDASGLLEWVDNRYYNHTQIYPDTTTDLSKSQHDYKGWIEDGILNNFKFKMDLSKGSILESLKVQFVAYNILDDSYFPIQTHEFNLAYGTVAPIGGYDAFQMDISSTRGFNLPAGDQFNLVKFKSDTRLYGTNLYYDVVFGMKIDWQKWIRNNDAGPSFLNLSELFKGFNQYSAQYKSGYWELRFLYTAVVNNSIAITNYELLSPEITIRKYDVDGNAPPKWVGVITTHTEDGSANITPYVLSNAKTLFKTVWTWNTSYGVMGDNFQQYVGIHRIEPHYSPSSNSIEEFSSLRFNLNEKLKPVSGSTLLKVTVGVNTITTECLIDYKELDKINYKLSSRLYALVNLLGLAWEDIDVKWEEVSLDWEIL